MFFGDSLRNIVDIWLSPESIADSLAGDAIKIVDITQDSASTFSYLVSDEADGSTEALAVVDSGGQLDDDWLRRKSVVATSQSSWEISLQSQRYGSVDIVNMRPQLVGDGCEDPLLGTLVVPESEGSVDKIPLFLQIDSIRPTFEVMSDGEPEPFFTGSNAKKISLSRDEVDTIVMQAQTNGPHCQWTVIFDYIADGRRGSLEIDAENGEPFELAGELHDSSGGLTDFSKYPVVYYLPLACPSFSGGYVRLSGPDASKVYTSSGPGCPP